MSGGSQVRGANLTLKPTQSSFEQYFLEWDWSGWIKPQIDLAYSAGANAIRLIGDVHGVYAGSFSMATYRSRWRQVIDYAAAQGMKTYVCGGGVTQFAAMTPSDVTAVITQLSAEINGRPEVLAFDILNESHYSPIPETGMSPTATWVGRNGAALSAAVRGTCDRKITYSVAARSARIPNDVGTRAAIREAVDFFDYHVYFDTAPADWDSYWRTETKPLLFGEFGSSLSSGEAAQRARFQAVRSASAQLRPDGRHAAGALVWAVQDDSSDPANQWGLYTGSGQPRQYLLDSFGSFPTQRVT